MGGGGDGGFFAGRRGVGGGFGSRAKAAKRHKHGVGGLGDAGRRGAAPATGKLGEALGALRAVAERGFRVWARANAARVGAALAAALAADESLTSNETPKDWEEEKVADEGDDSPDAGMTLRLPALPSPYVLAALHAASAEALRCGGHLLAPPALHALAAAAAEETVGAYAQFFGGSGSLKGKVSEKGVLQALFDVRLLVDVLAGGSRPSGGGGGSPVAGAAAWADEAAAAAVSAAEAATAALVEELDPIDWATYESFLWRNERRSYQRSAVLLGLFAQLRRLHAGETAKPPPGSGAGAPAPALPPRFSYLPVSLPTLRGGHGGHGAQGGGGGKGGKLPGAIDWDVAGFNRFGAVGSGGGSGYGHAHAHEEGGNFLGKLGQGLGLGKGALGWA